MKRIFSLLLFLSLFPLAATRTSAQQVINGNQTLVPGGSISTQVANDAAGTTLNKLAKLTNTGTAVISATTDISGVEGIVSFGAGTSGKASITKLGQTLCVFDGATTAGDYVINSITVAGDCEDGGAILPVVQNLGKVLSTNASAGTYSIIVSVGGSSGVGGGDCTSTVHGLVPTPPNDSTKFLSGTCGFAIPIPAPSVGPNPIFDITNAAYGGRAIYPAPQTTATCVSSSTAVTIAAGGTFIDGDGVTIYGCGVTETMTTPSAPTVASGITTTLTVPDAILSAATASSTYSYKIVSRDKFGGFTVASPATTITNGFATLGQTTATVTSETLTGSSLTVVLSATSPLIAGDLVHIKNSTNASLSYWGTIDSVSGGGATLNFVNLPIYSKEGLSSTGGTATYFIGNKITWTNSGSNIWETLICAKRPGDGSYHAIGLSLPVNEMGYPSSTSFVDWGPPMTTLPDGPAYISDALCSAGSPTNDYLTTRIVSGSAGTHLVLADAASQNLSAQTIQQDNGPAIKAAAVAAYAAAGASGVVYIPNAPGLNTGYFLVNSFLDFTPYYRVTLVQNGAIALYETMVHPQNWTGVTGGGTINLGQGSATPLIGCHSFPCVYYGNGQQRATFVDHISFDASGNQSIQYLYDEGDQNSKFSNLNIGTNADANDYTGMGMVIRPGTFNSFYDNLAFSSGPCNGSTCIDKSWTPDMYFAPGSVSIPPNGQQNVQGWNMRRMNFLSRTFYELTNGGDGSINVIDGLYSQGAIMPMVTIQANNSTLGMPILFSNFRIDTSGQPWFMALGGVQANLTMQNMGGLSAETGGTPAAIVGLAPQSLCNWNTNYSTGAPPLPTAFNSSCNFNGANFYANDWQDTGTFGVSVTGNSTIRQLTRFTSPVSTLSGFFVPIGVSILAVPSASAGGTIPDGSHTYCAHAVDWNFAYGMDSCQTITITGSNQTLDFSVTAVTGARGYQITEDASKCLPAGNTACTTLTMTAPTTTLHYTGGAAAGNTIPVFTGSGGGIQGFNASGHFGSNYLGYETSAKTALTGACNFWDDNSGHRWKFNCNGGSTDTMAGLTDLLSLTTPTVSTSITLTETTTQSGVSSADVLWGNSSNHWLEFNPNNTGTLRVAGASGVLVSGHCAQWNDTTGTLIDNGSACGSGGTGTVTTFTAGTLAPLFTTSVATPGTTPALTFTLSNAAGDTVFGNCTGSSAAPSYCLLIEGQLPAATVFTDQNATFGAHTYDFSSATILKAKVSAGYAPTVDGQFGVNSTTHLPVFGFNSASTITIPVTIATVSHDFLTSYTQTTGAFTQAQPTLADVAGGVSPAGAYDFSAATDFDLPVSAGCASTANGDICYDTTNKNWHVWTNAADKLMGVWTAVPTNGNCVKASVASSVVLLTDAACSGATLQTNSVNNSSQTTLNFTDTSGASGIAFTNPSGGVQSASLANVAGGGNSTLQGTLTGPAQGDVICENGSTILANCTPGIAGNSQTGTTYTVLSSDRGKTILICNASAIAVTLPQANSTGFGSNFFTTIKNDCNGNGTAGAAGAVTITPTTSTVDGKATLLLLEGMSASISSQDNVNYESFVRGYASRVSGSISGAIVGIACDSGTVTINGAATSSGMVATVTPNTYPGAGLTWSAYVSGANTVTVQLCSDVTVTPTASTYNVNLVTAAQ